MPCRGPAHSVACVDLINDLIMQAVASPWLLPTLFAVTVIDGFFPPIPSETVLVAAAAVAASTGDYAAVVTFAIVAGIAATIGDNIAFAIGRRIDTTRFGWMRRPRIAAAFGHARTALEQRSAMLILGARYIPVGRVAVNMSAGALAFPWRRFLPLNILAGSMWSAFSVAIGLLAGAWVEDQPQLSAGVGVALALIIGVVVDRVAAFRRRRRPEPMTVPQLEMAG